MSINRLLGFSLSALTYFGKSKLVLT